MAPMRNQSTAIANARRSANNSNFVDVSTSSTSTSTIMNNNNSSSSSNPLAVKGSYPLQRGSACLSCRKRKMKCDAAKPICQQCIKGNRAGECEYDDGKTKSRTQMLQDKVSKLQDRIKELETKPSRHSSASPPSPASSTMQPTSSSTSYPTTLTQTHTHTPHHHSHSHHNSFDNAPGDIYGLSVPSHSSIASFDTSLFGSGPPGVLHHPAHLDVAYTNQAVYSYSSASSSGSASPGPPDFALTSSALPPHQSSMIPSHHQNAYTLGNPSWGLRTENDGQWWANEELTPQWRQTLYETSF